MNRPENKRATCIRDDFSPLSLNTDYGWKNGTVSSEERVGKMDEELHKVGYRLPKKCGERSQGDSRRGRERAIVWRYHLGSVQRSGEIRLSLRTDARTNDYDSRLVRSTGPRGKLRDSRTQGLATDSLAAQESGEQDA